MRTVADPRLIASAYGGILLHQASDHDPHDMSNIGDTSDHYI